MMQIGVLRLSETLQTPVIVNPAPRPLAGTALLTMLRMLEAEENSPAARMNRAIERHQTTEPGIAPALPGSVPLVSDVPSESTHEPQEGTP